ncbi:hypothetical protein M3Y99_00682100 [Aphelenchoides fujianensis]|nr:hypothetical protein M3Y99_00682100 [Aphelenchoides fujianensis]
MNRMPAADVITIDSDDEEAPVDAAATAPCSSSTIRAVRQFVGQNAPATAARVQPNPAAASSSKSSAKIRVADEMPGRNNSGQFLCGDCGAAFGTMAECVLHFRYPPQMTFECSFCSYRVADFASRNEHERRCHRMTRAPSWVHLKQKMAPHSINHLSRQQGPFLTEHYCQRCDFAFAEIFELHKHNADHHSGQRFVCSICLNTHASVVNRNRHERLNHSFVRPERFCRVREAVPHQHQNPSHFIQQDDEASNSSANGGMQPTCSPLVAQLNRPLNLMVSQAIHQTANGNRNLPVYSVLPNGHSQPSASNMQFVSMGVPQVAPQQPTVVNTPKGSAYACADCGKSFVYLCNYERHRRECHTRPFACSLCARQFVTAVYRNAHEVAAHRLHRPAYAAAEERRMNQQELRVAAQLKGPLMTLASFHFLLTSNPLGFQFKCAECRVAFAGENELNGHNKHQHPALKYECFKCDARFTLPSLRNRHESKTHAFERDKAYKKMKKHPKVEANGTNVQVLQAPAAAQGHGAPVQRTPPAAPVVYVQFVPMDPVQQVAAPAVEVLPNDQPLVLSPSSLAELQSQAFFSALLPEGQSAVPPPQPASQAAVPRAPLKVRWPKEVDGVQKMSVVTDDERVCRYCAMSLASPELRLIHEQKHVKWTGHQCRFCGVFLPTIKLRKTHEVHYHTTIRRGADRRDKQNVRRELAAALEAHKRGEAPLIELDDASDSDGEAVEAVAEISIQEEEFPHLPPAAVVDEPPPAIVEELPPVRVLAATRRPIPAMPPLNFTEALERLNRKPTLTYYDHDDRAASPLIWHAINRSFFQLFEQFGHFPVDFWLQNDECKLLILRLKAKQLDERPALGAPVWTARCCRYELPRSLDRTSHIVCFAKAGAQKLLDEAADWLNATITFAELAADILPALRLHSAVFIASDRDRHTAQTLGLESHRIHVA